MLQMRTICISALLFCFVVVATGARAEEIYFPLARGMEWIMDLQVISPKGGTTNGVLHRKIGEPVEFGGKTYFRSHTWLEGDRPFHMDYTKLVRRDSAGFYSIDERDPKRVEKQGGKLPLKVGAQWENRLPEGVLRTTVLAKEDVTLGTNVYKTWLMISTGLSGSFASSSCHTISLIQ